jgi:hypothetical protein
MTPSGFRRALGVFARRRPFRPFRIEFFTGEEIVVRHPEAVDIRDHFVAYIATDMHVRLFDSFSVCQLLEMERQSPPDLGPDRI